MHTAYRILVVQLFQETHGFSPVHTPLTSFEIEQGVEMIEKNEKSDSVLGGLIRELASLGHVVVPAFAARARCGGKVQDAAYAFIKERILAAVRSSRYDAIALDLHGCTQSESLDSVEEDLLSSIREITGYRTPLVAGFDLHAHATEKLFRLLNFGTAYKTNPHADAAQTGARLAQVLDSILLRQVKPQGFHVLLPMLLGGNDETTIGPLATLHQTMQTAIASNGNLLDYSIFNVNPFIDGAHVGQAVVVYAKNEDGAVAAKALSLTAAEQLWECRNQFTHQLPCVKDLLQTFSEMQPRLIIGDFGDRVLAGAPGDSIHVLNECLQYSERHITAIVTDPAAYEQCLRAKEGSTVSLSIGGKNTPGLSPMDVSGKITRLGNGVFRNRGAFMKGAKLRLGPFAVIEQARYTLLVTQDAVMSQDPGCYLDAGISLDDTDVIIVKSGYHFKMAFEDYGDCYIVETPGLSGFHPEQLPFEKCRPIYPLDSVELPFLESVYLQ